MVIILSPEITVFPQFVLHYEIRSVSGVILELYKSSYWVIGLCLTVFSVLIPLTKAGLTFFVLETKSLSRRFKIAKFLHAISKWSMADVFVAAIPLADFAVKSNKSTQAELFLGFYYFLAYCLLSLVTTALLQDKVEGGAIEGHLLNGTMPLTKQERPFF
jgi:paraquat-inducible protein A